jgi:VanZ family protein
MVSDSHRVNETTFRRVLWVLLILNMAAIFYLSHKPADESTVESDIFVNLPQQFFESANPELSPEEIYNVLQFIVRKIAHVIEFTTLSIWATGLLILYRAKYAYFLGFLFSSIYAATDEIHQIFIPGREAKWSDLVFDMCGALLGAVIVWVIVRKREEQADAGTQTG